MISAEVPVVNSPISLDISTSTISIRTSFFWKRDVGKSATIEEKSTIPTEKSLSSDFMFDFFKLGIDAADIEVALADGAVAVAIDFVPGTTKLSVKSIVNASAPKDG